MDTIKEDQILIMLRNAYWRNREMCILRDMSEVHCELLASDACEHLAFCEADHLYSAMIQNEKAKEKVMEDHEEERKSDIEANLETHIFDRIVKACEDADLAFWDKLADHFPEVKTCDFSVESEMRRNYENCHAVAIWYHHNSGCKNPELLTRWK